MGWKNKNSEIVSAYSLGSEGKRSGYPHWYEKSRVFVR